MLELSRTGASLDSSSTPGIKPNYKPVLIFLSETKQKENYVTMKTKELRLYNLHVVNPTGLSGGSVIAWRDDIKVEILGSSRRWISTTIELASASKVWKHVFVYEEPKVARRREFWYDFCSRFAEVEELMAVSGDFNAMSLVEDRDAGTPSSGRKKTNFKFESKWLLEENCEKVANES